MSAMSTPTSSPDTILADRILAELATMPSTASPVIEKHCPTILHAGQIISAKFAELGCSDTDLLQMAIAFGILSKKNLAHSVLDVLNAAHKISAGKSSVTDLLTYEIERCVHICKEQKLRGI